MATRRRVKVSEETPGWEEKEFSPKAEVISKRKMNLKVPAAVIVLVAFLGLYWWKTNSWPVVAVAGWRPITRGEVFKTMYQQGGSQAVESLITEKLVNDQIAKLGIKVTESDIDSKIEDIKKSLGAGTDLNQVIKDRGMTMDDVRKQVRLQLEVEKAVTDKIQVSDADVASFLKQNSSFISASGAAEQTAQARTMLQQQKMQTEINNWVQDLRTKGRVWKFVK